MLDVKPFVLTTGRNEIIYVDFKSLICLHALQNRIQSMYNTI